MNEEETKVETTETEEVKVEETAVEENKVEEATAAEIPAEDAAVEKNPEQEKKGLDITALLDMAKKNIKWIAIAVVALILICLIASCAGNGGDRFNVTKEENAYIQTDSETLMTLDGKEIIVDEGISVLTYSADKSLAVVKDKDDTLFVLDGTELVEVSQEVYYFVISQYGDVIAYMTDVEDRIGTLNLYTVSRQKSAEVADEVLAGDIVLSADGKSVAYVTDCEVEDGWFSSSVTGTVYVSKNGKEGKLIAKDAVPLAVSDGSKYIFYIKGGDKLFVNEEKLASEISSRVYFNQDCTEIVFNEDDDTMYYTVKMKAPVKVKKGSFSGIYAPANMVSSSALTNNSKYAMEVYGVDTFNKLLWRLDYCEAYYVFDKGEKTEKLSSYLTNYQMSPDGNSMLYQDGGELILIENITKSREGESVARGLYNVNKFVASEDLKDIYYYNYEDDELCYLKKGEGVRIADDAEEFVYSDKYGLIYFIEDDELFYAAKTAKSVKNVCGEEVTAVYSANGVVYFIYEEDGVYSVMKMTGKAKYETLLEED